MGKLKLPVLVLIAILLLAGDWVLISNSMSAGSPVIGGDVIINGQWIYWSNIVSLLVGAAVVMLFTLRLRDRHQELTRQVKALEEAVDALSGEVQTPLSHGYPARQRTQRPTLADKVRDTHRELRAYVEHLRQQAFVDSLTGAHNRVAYGERLRSLNAQISTNMARFSLAVFEVKDMKEANNRGREVGDRLLCDAATLIREVFGEQGLYRVGGDNFAVLAENVDAAGMESRLAELDERISAYNRNGDGMPLSIARGATTFRPGQDRQYNQIYSRAEEAMFDDRAQDHRGSRL